MANVSSAYGTVKITADNDQAIRDLLSLHELTEEPVYYQTEFESDCCADFEMHTQEIEGKRLLELSFTGDGRWDITSNFARFWDTLFSENNELTTKVKQNSYPVQFDYFDEEAGCAFIAEGTYITQWDAETQKSSIISDESETYPYTAANLMRFGFTDEAYDSESILDDWDEFVSELYDGSELKAIAEKQPDTLKQMIEERQPPVLFDPNDLIDYLDDEDLATLREQQKYQYTQW